VLEAILQDADMELHVLRDHAIARRDMQWCDGAMGLV
jgi:hypothetical protein